ncbi:minor capsid protein [Amycolatopsis sp. H20-H5]|uniref:minor capsid protein n=1 Tax=Amycolatopsis sp. H20-H5 TaxID=3046309 RepID=UPI002DB65D21|nr:minor capsid protein [Amycolatopsis sp. H20-H5]MEC3977904.1 minor capsid protein [Amycolatopsis sp. H20-H5]
MSLTGDLARLLAELGLGTYTPGASGGSIYLSTLPQVPDTCTAVARYAGPESDTRLPYDELNVQVRCRGAVPDAEGVEDRAQAVYDALHGLGDRRLAGGAVLQLAVGNQSGPVFIGRDTNGRPEWTVNFRMELRRSTPNRIA